MGEHQGMPHEEFDDEITITDRIQRVGRDSIESEFLGQEFSVDAECISSECSGSQGALIRPGDHILETLCISHERGEMAHEPVRKANGLGRLQMSVPGHENIDMFLGKGGSSREKGCHVLQDIPFGFDRPEASVCCHLIVSRTTSVQLSTCGTDNLCKSTFIERMDIFVSRFDFDFPVHPFLSNLFQSIYQQFDFLVGDDSDFSNGLGIGNRSTNVLCPHPFVERDTFVEFFHNGIGPSLESTACSKQTSSGARCLFTRRRHVVYYNLCKTVQYCYGTRMRFVCERF
mmetsp:Transcript_30558/g.50775  ORF Transcript_30558/g.50775 Transcript_30558/m.50775 type:complete len:287 (-) Transcript_30558:6-866(-)